MALSRPCNYYSALTKPNKNQGHEKMIKSKFFIAIALLLLWSCSTVKHPTSSNITRVFSDKPTQTPQAPLSSEAPKTYAPDFNPPSASSRYSARRPFHVSVHEADAREFFMGLVVDSAENIVVHPDVKGLISLELKNVTVPQVLDAVQKVYGYDYKKTDIGYIIYPATLQTKTYKIDRLDLLREGKSNTYVSSGQTGNSNQGYGNQQNQNSMQQQFNTNQPNNYGYSSGSRTSGSSITTTTKTDFWEELETALHTLISVDKEATVVINKQSGVVIARAKPMQLREIESFLNATQNQISRQVILEAKILEVVLNDSHQDGVEWKSIIREGLQTAPILGGDPGTVFTLASRAGSFRAGDFTAVVTLLESQGKTNVLSSPRISTLNNQQAIIKVGKDETFVTGISPGIVAGGISGGTVQPAPILSSFFSGIALDVTPQINDEGDITLHIHPSITDVKSQDREFTIDSNGTQSVVPTALSVIRESDSIVKAKDGQIVVLGGLMQDNGDENKEGVTGFSRIPFLGNLFRVNTGTRQKTELVILLKATLINSDDDWQNDIDASHQRFKTLDATPRWR
jgi:MSHA biogenesis protein MshL